MEAEYEIVLRKIYEAAIKTKDCFQMNCDIGVNSDKRKVICHWLQDNGYILSYSPNGKSGVTCKITEKTIRYFEK